ncbi:TAXI family TRAP transporter solute-binding subunit [Streptomyces sodiiphilus]|uniref:TAXI family TRAP transporter solute-binding subunit n=1 Tax=Streptomyces sodiiphilus TaxID=226217 RepID=A0ABN2PL84_9ACTN
MSVPRPSRRQALTWGGAAVTAAGAAAAWRSVFTGEPRPGGDLTLSTGVPSGVYARYGRLLQSQLARDLPEVRMRLTASEGSVQNIERLLAGEADFTIATADSLAAHQAAGGEGSDRMRACARLYDDYLHLVVPRDSAVRGARDLGGLLVGVGQDQSGVQLVTRELLAAAGLDMDKDVSPVREGINAMPRMLEAGRLDGFFWSGGLPTSAVRQLSQRAQIRLVPLGELLQPLRARGPHTAYYRAAVMPPDAYPEIAGGQVIDTLAVANLLVTTVDADAALTEQITRSVINGRDRIGRQVHAAQRVDLRTAIYTQPLELHPGAGAYYRSVKS